MEWRDKLNKFLDDLENNKLFENDYKITYPCRYKLSGRWIKAKIDMEHKIIYGLDGEELRRCN